jgi:hypothetical protein
LFAQSDHLAGRTIRTQKTERAVERLVSRISLITGLAGVMLACSLAGSAGANSYDVWSCRGPAGEALSMAAWRVQTNNAEIGDVWKTDDCITGGPAGLHANPAGIPGRNAKVELVFDLPRDARISGYRLNRSIRTVGAVTGYNYAAATREYELGTYTDSGCASYLMPPSFNCSNEGTWNDSNDPANIVDRQGIDLAGLGAWAGCYSTGCSAAFASPAAEYNLFQSVVSVVDDDAPSVVGFGGSLARSTPVSGIGDLFVEAQDTNAGVRTFTLSVDGNQVYSKTIDTSPTCVVPYEVPRPCPAQTGQILTVDTTGMTPGPHSASGTVIDAAGNVASFGPIPFTVADPGPGPEVPDNGNPAVADPQLSFDRDLVQHAPGKAAELTGRLTTTGGQPIAGAQLDLVSTSLGGRSSVETPMDPVRTGIDGTFSVASGGVGARRITASFSPIRGGIASRTATATVRSQLKVTFKAKPRRIKIGRTVRFTGRIIGAGPSGQGVGTEIQAISGGRWQTVANVTARKNGKFIWKYRFRHVERNAIFSFRALVRSNPGWPWPTVKSKKLKIRIRVPGS